MPVSELEPELQYVDEEPLVYTEDNEDWKTWYPEPTQDINDFNRFMDNLPPVTEPSPEYIQSFQSHDSNMPYNPDISIYNYTLAGHYLDQIQQQLIHLEPLIEIESDGTLYGLAMSMQATLNIARNGVNEAVQEIMKEYADVQQ